jgi:cell division protein ZapE
MHKPGVLEQYRELLSQGRIKPDSAQALAVEKLASLAKALTAYHPEQGEQGWLSRFGFGTRSPKSLQWRPGDAESDSVAKQGLYIFGDVGRGKSMLMDLFCEAVPVEKKRRVHFHAFMQEVHASIFAWQRDSDASRESVIPDIAREIAQKNWLLCFDELQVTDIADAMILGRLFDALFSLGVVVVTTSNRAPDDLYKDGLQRERFLPFITEIKQRLDLLELDSARDYRLGRKRGMQVYFAPIEGAETKLDAAFAKLTGGKTGKPEPLTVLGRTWMAPRASDGVARFSFAELCSGTFGPADYLALATHYHTLILDAVPILSPANRDSAKRFVTLIDALYEHKVTFLCSAESVPETLYPAGDGSFEFHRTVSRLMEMQSADYLTQSHLP